VALYVAHTYSTPLGLKPLLHLLPHSVTDLLPIMWYHSLENITWPQVVALITFPVMAGKQVINCVQFWKASKLLVEADQEERWVKQNEKKE